MKHLVFAASIAALSVLGFHGKARADAAPPTVTFTGGGYAGTGCPLGTVDVALSVDKTLLYAAFDQYVARTLPGGSSFDRKNCQLRVGLHFTPGWSVAISRVDYRGFASLKAGVTGEQKTTYFFAGGAIWGDTFASTRLVGPYFDNYARGDSMGIIRYSPCGEADPILVVNTEVRVKGVEGEMTLDSIIHKLEHTYVLSWKKCV